MTIRVAQISTYDTRGGAARAAWRIHKALLESNVLSRMYVECSDEGDWTVCIPKTKIAKVLRPFRPEFAVLINRLMNTPTAGPFSTSMLRSGWDKRINKLDTDIVNLHWICSEMMSIEEIGRIAQPVVWTLHDMWAFCGAEHYASDDRWMHGYSAKNRPTGERGIDLNRWAWSRKSRAWRKPIQIVTPSQWLADCVSQSVLMRGWPVRVIPNALDIDFWKPVDSSAARTLLKLPTDTRLVAFGAFGGSRDPRKGMDLLAAALRNLTGQIKDLELVVFGENRPQVAPPLGFPVHYMGHLNDELSLKLLYSAVDAVVIPSRKDNLPNIGSEALACGTPVIAFNVSGLPDIVVHQETGWLADAYDVEDLARGLIWVLDDAKRLATLGTTARNDAVSRFAYPVVAKQYRDLYTEVLHERA